MKTLIYILIAAAAALVIYNAFQLDFNNLLQDDSSIAVISILAGFCSILLLVILLISQKIAKKSKRKI
ncbi:hypothetical protein [Aequorivita echinoideorum]|uniref:Lipopolysaccharide assembly protein A domain-containing protein n=1 Tax=Aequorivita echinoideorum TaxID=1549647 RepID=A0ABS5S3Q2_9FLAO|nr:hypothetical protein [Aequorivita echinoideorum]MBT0607836.1 hypothetical protein [Aequorivita echinoideorum]